VGLCYNYYKPVHKSSECPNLKSGVVKTEGKVEAPKPRGRAFQITAAEAKVEPNVVTGIFLVNLILAHVSFDMGASKSFVTYDFIRNPSFVINKLLVPLEVEIADSKSFLVFMYVETGKSL
jgi:hypothetical protein